MSTIRIAAVLVLLLLALAAAERLPGAAPPGPSREQIARWVEDLPSDDADVWRLAVDRLWKAGPAAEPALKAARKHRDPDVQLRVRLILTRFDWGIFPDTPARVVKS